MVSGPEVASYRDRHGKFFLVDCGFANRRQILAPFRGVRYHLQDFAGNDRDPVNANELFNLRHASLRNVVERIFGLHNFLRKECRSDEFPIEQEDDESEDEENDDELGNQTQEQQRQITNAWRAGIATKYVDRCYE
ncbi:unnamed protein product [Malus baccata var. baccata]